MDDKTLRTRINKELRWCLSGSGYTNIAHIAKHKGNATALCGTAVDSHYNLVRWRDLCKRCRKGAETYLITLDEQK